jgi:LPS-assembly protein
VIPLPLAPFRLTSLVRLTPALLCGLCATPTLLAQAVPAAAPAPQAADLDWMSWDNLTDAQKAQIPDGCCGIYVEPPLLPVAGNPGQLLINGATVDTAGDGIVEISGGLTAQQDSARVRADSGSFDQNSQTFTLTGNIQLRQPGLLLVGDSATADRALGSAELHNASYVLHEEGARGTASVIVYKDAAGIITIDNGIYSRCEPGSNAWALEGDSFELNQTTGMGTARHVTLRVKDVPVLYLPWVRFPITDQRASGFLAPVIGNTRDGGLDVAAPYYLNLAPNYDATLTPRIQSERGAMLGVETRYLGSNWQQVIDANYLPDDKLYDPATANTAGSDSPPTDDRWALNYDFNALLGRGWSANASYRAISDFEYFQDIGSNGLMSTTQSFLYRSANVNYNSRNWAFSAATQDIQLIDPNVSALAEPYRTLPRLTLDGTYYLSNLEYGVESEYTIFDRDLNPLRFAQSDIANGVLVTGSRLAVTPKLSLPLSNSYAFFTPTAKYKYASWNLDDWKPGATDSPSRGIFSANIDSGLIFERDTTIAGQGFRQTLEPRLFYLYNEYEDQDDIPLFDTTQLTFSFNQLFRDDRFSGADRVGDANQLTLAVSSRLYDSNGREKARFSLGQIQYFEDRRVTLATFPGALPGIKERQSGSAVTGEVSYQIADRWRTGSYVEWNTHENSLDVGNVQLQYQSDDDHILNIGYRYRDMPAPIFINGFDRRIKQTDVSAVWPLAASWNLVGRWNYDYSNNRSLESIVGLEYSNCCWNIRVIARQWIDNTALFFGREDNNTGVFVQFELKGLGSLLGGNVSSILNNGITGYQDRNNGRF